MSNRTPESPPPVVNAPAPPSPALLAENERLRAALPSPEQFPWNALNNAKRLRVALESLICECDHLNYLRKVDDPPMLQAARTVLEQTRE